MKQKVKKVSVSLLMMVVSTPLMAAGGEGHGFDWVQLIAHIVNFTVFFGGLFYLIGPQIKSFFTDRVKGIKDSLAVAEKSREEAKKRLDEIEEKMGQLDQELAEIERKAREDAERERARIQAQAEQDAAKIMDQAKAEVANLRREALLELKAYVADKATAEAERQIREAITDEDHQRLFAEFTTRLGAKS